VTVSAPGTSANIYYLKGSKNEEILDLQYIKFNRRLSRDRLVSIVTRLLAGRPRTCGMIPGKEKECVFSKA
jgi:hypothetical protein